MVTARAPADSSTGISSRGFLPEADPLLKLPSKFALWDELGSELPRLLVSGKVRNRVNQLVELDPNELDEGRELRRAMLVLSFLGHAYVWGEAEPAKSIPAALARPWHFVAERLGRPPVLSYASYALDNWRRLESTEPVQLGNLALLQHFLGGADEEWFITVHIDIEARAARALHALFPAREAAAAGNWEALEQQLQAVAQSLEAMYTTLARTPEWCDPYTYFLRVRPFIFGWKDHPALPEGLIYEGVDAFAGKPQQFRGETGAQSSIIPALDAILGIQHNPDPLRKYLMEMRQYMPPEHRRFIERLEQGPSVLSVIEQQGVDHASVREAFNACVHFITQFRTKHLEFAARYIHQQSQRTTSNPTEVGTGGTPFMRYLKKHRDETEGHHVTSGRSTRPA